MTSEFIHIEMRHEDDGSFNVNVQIPEVEDLTDLLLAVLALCSDVDKHVDEQFSQVVRFLLNGIAEGTLGGICLPEWLREVQDG